MTTSSLGIWNVAVFLLVSVAVVASLIYLWRRGVANEECINCRQNLGTHFVHELTRSEPPLDIYRKFRVCRHCGSRLLIKEYTRRQKS